jgi:hypothetical protein
MPRELLQRGFRLVLLAVLAAALVATGGCGGDSEDDPQQQAAKKKKEEPKPDFEVGRLMTQPNSLDMAESSFKPGHWTSATLEVTSNARDFKGELTTEPFELDGMPFDMGSSRPALLPKGQKKYLELTFYIPPGKVGSRISTRLLSSRWGGEVAAGAQPTFRMPEHQFYFVVLARSPDRYAFLKVLDSVRPPMGTVSDEKMTAYYRVLLPRIRAKVPVPLPSHALAWTSIAYLLWDDLDPGALSSEQQEALLDWLHWGGQLIVSGPGTLDTLRGSFLEPYLPATAEGPLEVSNRTLEDLNARWTLAPANAPGRRLVALKLWTGVKLNPRADAVSLVPPSAKTPAERAAAPLLVERRIGRGRIVLSAFGLSQRELIAWPSFDGFVNGCLLRRLPREYSPSSLGEPRVKWKDPSRRVLDPQLVSAVRYFSRDAESVPAAVAAATPPPVVSTPPAAGSNRARPFPFGLRPPTAVPAGPAAPGEDAAGAEDTRLLAGNDEVWLGTSAAGWSDFNRVADTARNALRRAAGVVIPRGSFILFITAAYLLVLVPLNWAIFHVMGRVEWAWFAVPVIAVLCAVAVVRMARLDIGFVRAKTEIAVVEVQGDYPRAHVTRYTALYTSLATSYDAHFDDPGALAQPFAGSAGSARADQRRVAVEFRRDEDVSLTGFAVASNSTGMLHSEQMLDMQGSISLGWTKSGEEKITNGTRLRLEGVAVVRPRRGGVAGEMEAAWVRSLDSGAAVVLRFGVLDDKFLAETWDTTPVTAKPRPAVGDGSQPADGADSTPDLLNLRELIDLARDPEQYRPGDVRLIAWVDKELPGMRIEPASSQGRHAALVVANLGYHAGAAPEPDANARPPMNNPPDEND